MEGRPVPLRKKRMRNDFPLWVLAGAGMAGYLKFLEKLCMLMNVIAGTALTFIMLLTGWSFIRAGKFLKEDLEKVK